jgi:hypothetical protein
MWASQAPKREDMFPVYEEFIRRRLVRSQCWYSSSNSKGPLNEPQIRYDGYIESNSNEFIYSSSLHE